MRKLMISLLMAGAAATPAIATAQDTAAERRAERQQARADRQSAREDRSSAREDRSSAREDRSSAREQRVRERQVRADTTDASAMGQRNAVAPVGNAGAGAANQRPSMADIRQNRADMRAQEQESRDARKARYAEARKTRLNGGVPVVSNTPKPNTQPPAPTTVRHSPAPTWSSAWRNNNRYNWYNHRKRNRWLFSLGFYNDPFGWGYSPYSIGWRMWPSYYGRSYWLNDPWQYRLPYSPPGTRWIRYYDDAILVDTWSGQVLDVIYDFFW